MMAVKIGNAVRDENGGIAGGKIGDQDGKEVRIQDFYVKGWTSVFRAKSSAMADAIATNMAAACVNDNIGYSQQANRYTLFESLKANGKNMATACGDCDCSELVRLCCWLAGANLAQKINTSNMLSEFKKSGQFEILTDTKYLTSDDYAKRGDIYLRQGHTFVVLEDGSKVGTNTSAVASNDLQAIGEIIVDQIDEWCNVRSGAGTENSVIGKAYPGEVYKVYAIEEEWYKINYHGQIGFIWYELVSENLPGNVDAAAISDGTDQAGETIIVDKIQRRCNVRSEPDDMSTRLGYAYRNDVYTLLGERADGWYMIDYHGQTAYIWNGMASKN